MESWKIVWRDGFSHCFTREQLTALATGLRNDDAKLLQGATTMPPPLMCVQDWPVEGACVLGYAYWKASADPSSVLVGEVEEWFARCCFDADQRLGEPAACRWFLNWFDDTPRDRMRLELLEEVERSIGLLGAT